MKTPTLRTLNHRTLLAALLIAAAGSPFVHAEPADDAPLQGPQVKDRKVPGGKSSFGDSTQNRRGEGRPEPRLFMAALRDLGAPDAPEGIRAEPDQMEEIRGILEEFREDQRAFREEHAEEFRTLRKEAGMPERQGAGPGAPGAPDDPAQRERRRGNQSREDRKEARADLTPEQQAAREKLRELNEKGPKFEAYQTRAWAVLSEPQQAFVQGRMEELRKEVEAARAEGRRPNLGNDERPPRGPGGDNPQRERRRGRGPGAPGNPGTNDNPPPPPGDDEMMSPPPPGDGEA